MRSPISRCLSLWSASLAIIISLLVPFVPVALTSPLRGSEGDITVISTPRSITKRSPTTSSLRLYHRGDDDNEKKSNSSSIGIPVLNADFPDPSLTLNDVDDSWYAFATGGNGAELQIARGPHASSSKNSSSSVLSGPWEILHPPEPPINPDTISWTNKNNTNLWAPDVSRLSDGRYILYFSGEVFPSSPSSFLPQHCVGALVSSNGIAGPYEDIFGEPFYCDLEKGGAIDLAAFTDGPDYHEHANKEDPEADDDADNREGDEEGEEGKGRKRKRRWVVYKVDGNSVGRGGVCGNTVDPKVSTPIILQEVSDVDGFTKIGDPVVIMDREEEDGPLVEAPSLIWMDGDDKKGWFSNVEGEPGKLEDGEGHEKGEKKKEKTTKNRGMYVLFFSSGCYEDESYDVKYATSREITGPYTRGGGGAVMYSGDKYGLDAPGGASAVKGEGLVFHANCGEKEGGGKLRCMHASDFSMDAQPDVVVGYCDDEDDDDCDGGDDEENEEI